MYNVHFMSYNEGTDKFNIFICNLLSFPMKKEGSRRAFIRKVITFLMMLFFIG